MRTAPIAAILLASSLLAAPAISQDRPAGLVGSGVAASTRDNSPERPVRFATSVPAGASLIIPVAAPLNIARSAPGLTAEQAAAIQAAAQAARFEAKPLSTLKLHAVAGHPTVLLVGLEPLTTPKETALADAAGKGIQALRDEPNEIAILTGGTPPGSAPYVAFGASLGQYRYDRLKSDVKAPPANPITIASPDPNAAQAFAADLAHLASATRFARDLVTAPASDLYPESFVAAVQRELRGVPNVRIIVLDEPQMRALGMGSLLGVGQGSRRPSRLLAVEYRGGGSAGPIALVGKGIPFDSGGISIKPALGMW
ncbi:MAG: M17 family peptidase N-terminal domain-containing protein, partial [Sandaracinobacteroides sp.]